MIKLLLDASSYVEPDYISQITYHLSKLSREDQERLLWHLEQNNVFEIKKESLAKTIICADIYAGVDYEKKIQKSK